MRLVAWNIRAGGGRRIARIFNALERWAPDVVVLSEFRATDPSRTLATWLHHHGLHYQRTTACDDDPPRNALLVAARFPLRQRSETEYFEDRSRMLRVNMSVPSQIPMQLRIRPTPPQLLASAAATDRFTLKLTAVHVPNRVTGRKYDFLDRITRIAEATGPQELGIIVGDTNSGCRHLDEQSRAFNAREEGWFWELSHYHWQDAYRYRRGKRRVFSWYSPNGDNGFRLDQLFVSQAFLANLTDIDYRWGGGHRKSGVSDHAAIIADFDLDSLATGQPRVE